MNKLKPINILPGIATLLLFLIAATAFIAIQIKNKQQAEIDAALKALQNSHQLVNQVENTLESLYLAENQLRKVSQVIAIGRFDMDCCTNHRLCPFCTVGNKSGFDKIYNFRYVEYLMNTQESIMKILQPGLLVLGSDFRSPKSWLKV